MKLIGNILNPTLQEAFIGLRRRVGYVTISGADHLTSEGGGLGDFEKKYPAIAYA